VCALFLSETRLGSIRRGKIRFADSFCSTMGGGREGETKKYHAAESGWGRNQMKKYLKYRWTVSERGNEV